MGNIALHNINLIGNKAASAAVQYPYLALNYEIITFQAILAEVQFTVARLF